VGKNKVVDRMLGLLNMEREYVQLHRDTSVQSLTVSASLQGIVHSATHRNTLQHNTLQHTATHQYEYGAGVCGSAS